jgi:hypothetical protein
MTRRQRIIIFPAVVLLCCACDVRSGKTESTTTVPAEGARATPVATLTRATSTSHPSLTPSVTASTIAPAPLLFVEEFDAGAPYWLFMQAIAGPQSPEAQVEGGYLRLTLAVPDQWIYALYSAHTYADVRVDAQVELGADGEGATGLICRYDPATGWYEFNIYADQTYSLLFGQWLTEGVVRYTPLVVAESAQITPSVNRLGLACEGDILTPFINSVQMRRRQEKLHVLNGGQVGASAASFERAPIVITYDWISVSAP